MTNDRFVERYRDHDITRLTHPSPGWWIDGRWVTDGFNVCHADPHPYAGCNAMPAACWFQTVEDARAHIDILIQVNGDADEFWRLSKESAPA
jgi:hypothetical protein